jgi:dolichol-phosphate mannosyltransferase
MANGNGSTVGITLLTPVFNEEQSLPVYVERVGRVLLSCLDYRFSVLFVDDGSTDASWSLIERICAEDERFTGISLSRNYGSDIAIAAGLESAEGDAVVVLACDLQDPPEAVPEFLEKWREGARIVWGRRRSRRDRKWRVLTSRMFHRLFRLASPQTGSKFTTGGFVLIDRKVVDHYRDFRESNRMTTALLAWTGFRQEIVDYDRVERTAGVSGWNLPRMIRTANDAFLAFTTLPVRLITAASLVASLMTLALGVYALTDWLRGGTVVGWASTILAISGFFAVQFLLVGILGEYLHRILAEVVKRPLYLIASRTEPPSNGVRGRS